MIHPNTVLNHQLVVTVRDAAVDIRQRRAIALKVVELMYGEERHRYPDIPYTDYKEGYFWVLDNHNDWFLHFNDESRFTVRHRDPQERHMLILGGLQAAIDSGGLSGVLATA